AADCATVRDVLRRYSGGCGGTHGCEAVTGKGPRGTRAAVFLQRPRAPARRPASGSAMKVVLFCGGLGTRLREHSGTIPKPLANIGSRPILWPLMRYYAHFGHTDFVLCLGYGGERVRDYFLNYREEMTNDFTLHGGTRQVELHSSDIADWRITCL